MAHAPTHPIGLNPGQRGFQPGCGCCAGPVEDRCCCHFHCDIPMGLLPHKCSLHAVRRPA
jgi:hypothetical protein